MCDRSAGASERQADENMVEIGESFAFRLTHMPVGISSPHEIAMGFMMGALEYDLKPGIMVNEEIEFTRIL